MYLKISLFFVYLFTTIFIDKMSDESPQIVVSSPMEDKLNERAHELNLVNPNYYSSNLKYRRIQQVNGGTNVTIDASTPTQSVFTLSGAKVWNLAKSYITFDLAYTAAAHYTNVICDSIPIERIRFLTDSGQPIVDLSNAQVYTKIAQLMCLDLEEYNSRSAIYADTAIDAKFPTSNNFGCQPVKSLQIFTGNDGKAAQPYRLTAETIANVPSDVCVTTGTTFSALPADEKSGTDILFEGPLQHIATSADNKAVTVRHRVNLKAFVGTLFAVDKSLYFGQATQIEITWAKGNNWAFATTTLAGAGPAAATFPANCMSNLYLYCAEEINVANVNAIKDQFNVGFKFLVPWTTSSQNTVGALGAGSTYSVDTILTSGKGHSLKRVVSCIVASSNTLNETANLFNVGSVRYSGFQSMVDGVPVQDYVQRVAYSEPWNYLHNFFRCSVIGKSQRTYLENMFWVDNFADCAKSIDIPSMDWVDSGLDLFDSNGQSVQRTYTVQFSDVLLAGKVIVFPTYTQMLSISKDGILMGARLPNN